MSSPLSYIIETQVLHTTTTRALHAHNFSKTSTRATYILTNILSRYLILLSETCARHAQHAGRTGITVREAVSALEEIGVDIDELREYAEGEVEDLLRYTAQTAKRAEELAEIKSAIRDGSYYDPSNDIPLVYAPFDEEDISDDEAANQPIKTEEYPEYYLQPLTRNAENKDIFDVEHLASSVFPILSPEEPGSQSPPHKRTRLPSNSDLPDYIPNFFPPFPIDPQIPNSSLPRELTPPMPTLVALQQNTKDHPSSQPVESRTQVSEFRNDFKSHLPVRQPSPALPASTSTTSSYLTNIPYEQSSLANTPEWRLPKAAAPVTLTSSSSSISALLSSYSYLQSSSLSAVDVLSPNPLRHGLSMMLVGLSSRAYSPAATLFGSSVVNTCGPIPRRAAPLPAQAIPLDKNGKPIISSSIHTLPLPPPEWHARSVAGPIAYAEPTTTQGSRIPLLARGTLPHSVLTKSTRLVAPSPLERTGQKLFYGPPIPAHWNSGTVGEHKAPRGKDKDEDNEEVTKVLADAHLLAAWDYDPKDFRVGLPMARRGSKVGNPVFTSGNGPSLPTTLKRKRSEIVMGHDIL
ncbi:hypothetical protein Clacol_008223 [Clathrus columnatus]|uniref:Bromodomain associated domain-containing protein n=1 Tax=Clathrus columnatus TaxID=1419009 RepID=A0AAV5AH47_9AGAM|nr:hypothetical protein Clacol_008223 [Clathrus columnatus]